MNGETWQRAKQIFLTACDMPQGDRARYVDAECADDAELRDEVTSLLAAMPEQDDVARDLPGERPGTMIGPYELVECIGEGGFGTVWSAKQSQPIARQVAIKLVKPGMDTRQVIARFEQERQSLALMDHPNIARVYDAGTTEQGRPYFVMELVRGEPILAFCNRRRMPLRDRLALFGLIAGAVQHAHQKGVIHRDLKPSNVLVTEVDGAPQPKVIDFGIAKAIAGVAPRDATITAERQMLGTPQYMSPEQAEGSSDIDTRSDVYSLGVLLYELLTGFPPIDLSERSGSRAEMQRAIIEGELPEPSTRLKRETQQITRVAADRSIEPASLQRTVRGELDWIVMKCLEKDRRRRYQSAGAVAEDVRRYLAGEAIDAAPPSRAYRVSKFVRRHRSTVTTLALLGAFAIAGTAFYIRAINAERSKTLAALDEANRQRARAQEQAEIAEAVSQFQIDMLATADPDNAIGNRVTVLQATQAAVRELDAGKLSGKPLVEAGIRFRIGETMRSIGEYDAARKSFTRAAELFAATSPADSLAIARCENAIGLAYKLEDNYAEAERYYRLALDKRSAALGPNDLDLSTSLNNLASVLQDMDRLDEAEPLYQRAIQIRRANNAALPTAETLNNLATLKYHQKKLDEAAPMLKEVLDLRRSSLRPEHPMVGQSLNNYAMALQAQGKLVEAEAMMRESLVVRRAGLPAGHPDIAVSAYNLGRILIKLDRFADAEPLLVEALDIRRQKLGLKANQTTKVAASLADLYDRTGRPELAQSLRESAGLEPSSKPES
jgi:serine/threonine protein kinase/tetratricopeptide (TPR) repeat protein